MKNKWLYLALLSSPTVAADDLIKWWDISATGLYGKNYDLATSEEQATLTIETAGEWKYGDWFTFQDFTYFTGAPSNINSTNYGEISPRFSASKIFGQDFSVGAITDFSLALTLEEGDGPVDSFLYGIGMDFKLPYFTYFSLNSYRRQALNNDNNSDGWQLTPVFRMDFPVGDSAIVFDGFIDWVFQTDNDGYEENFHFNPQLKYDLGRVLFASQPKNKFLVGIEYDYWKNKYGVDGIDQNTYSVIAKYHF
ncbi:ion channel protein Tsx [uncultured Shewanella sp.]|uniref:ion channel protein Tsx n=1 Tax=uncultured Shewanella sp. TaxID=173975 RepID=UPI002607E0D3|nr:ion channel protein Tsx [uncultured Shewanella sp.]